MSPTVLVVGAGGALGAELSVGLREAGWDVSAMGATSETAEGEPAARFDLSQDAGVRALAETLRGMRPRLVVNAAVDYPPLVGDAALDEVMRAGLRSYAVNALGPGLALESLLREEPDDYGMTFVQIGSDSVFADNYPLYSMSKLSVHVYMASLAKRSHKWGIWIGNLLLGPLYTRERRAQFEGIAQRRDVSARRVEAEFVRRLHGNYAIDAPIDLGSCVASVLFLASLGADGNGAVVRIDGGAGGNQP